MWDLENQKATYFLLQVIENYKSNINCDLFLNNMVTVQPRVIIFLCRTLIHQFVTY